MTIHDGSKAAGDQFRLSVLLSFLFFVGCPRTTVALSSSSRKQNQQLARRRKNPALWRDDLEALPPLLPLDLSFARQKPEVMSPAGGWPQLRAAVGNGADSVYLGLSRFSARARATNFHPTDELPLAVQFCHDAAVKVYVALNTLVFHDELSEIAELVTACVNAKVDAVIVQDVGLAKFISILAPNLEIHASTQQTVTSADGVSFARQVTGSSRVVLGRELSVEEIQRVSTDLLNSEDQKTEIEAFVHGALCVSYSGQCFSSEAWGGRSANRGQCAQACRLPYGLIVNGELRHLQDMSSYLLSPQDLCGLDHVKDLIKAGVSCLKIEGRLKDATYVAATTRAYRNAVDQAWEDLRTAKEQDDGTSLSRRILLEETHATITKPELAQLFSRGQDEENDGLSSGFFEGSRHQRLVRGRSPRHRGVHVGRVLEGSSWKNGLIIAVDDGIELKRGDGLVVDRGMPQEEELGGPVFDVMTTRNGVAKVRWSSPVEKKWKKTDAMARKNGHVVGLAPVDAHVWRTSDATVEKKMRRLAEISKPRRLAKVSVSGSIGEPLSVTIAASDVTVTGSSKDVLEAAESSGLDLSKVRKAVGTLGNTGWAVDGDIDISKLEKGSWCRVSCIKEARRRAVEALQSQEASCVDSSLEHRDAEELLSEIMQEIKGPNEAFRSTHPETLFTVLSRNYQQVECLCELVEERGLDIDEIIIDFLEVDGMRDAVARVREAGVNVVIASPRILKPGEAGIWRTLLRLEPDSLLVRSPGLLYRMNQLGGAGAKVNVGRSGEEEHMVQIPKLIGDFSLNAANILTVYEYLNNGLERVTASYDLSANAITSLAYALQSDAKRLEVVVHAKLPIFHTEHCVFARFLSKGDSYLDCGHVCTRSNVHLRDETGADNLVLADMGCRNTVFAAQAQSGVHTVGQWKQAGVGRLRIELVDEGPDDIPTIVEGYLGVLHGEIKPCVVWESLGHVRDSNGRESGVSFGSLRNKVERRAGEVSY